MKKSALKIVPSTSPQAASQPPVEIATSSSPQVSSSRSLAQWIVRQALAQPGSVEIRLSHPSSEEDVDVAVQIGTPKAVGD